MSESDPIGIRVGYLPDPSQIPDGSESDTCRIRVRYRPDPSRIPAGSELDTRRIPSESGPSRLLFGFESDIGEAKSSLDGHGEGGG